MQTKTLKNVLILTIIIAFAFVSNACAWNGSGGYGKQQGQNQSQGKYQNQGKFGPSCSSNLSDEQIGKLNQQRSAFFQATLDLRQSMQQKQLELQAEMAKKEPDVSKAKKLQKELSKLRAEFDEKKLEFRIKMRKINPNPQY